MDDWRVVLVQKYHPASHVGKDFLLLLHGEWDAAVFVQQREQCASFAELRDDDQMAFLVADSDQVDEVWVRSDPQQDGQLSFEFFQKLHVDVDLQLLDRCLTEKLPTGRPL